MEEFLSLSNISNISKPTIIIIILASFCLFSVIFIMIKKTPYCLLRMFNKLFLKLFIKLHIVTQSTITKNQGTLLIANKISRLDLLLISMLTSRKIYFITDKEKYFSHFLFSIIPINDHKKCQQLLSEGNIVCLFPEQSMTKNGIIGKFEYDYRDYLPSENANNIEINLVYIARMWESVFSNLYINERRTFSKLIQHCIFHEASIAVKKLTESNLSAFAVRLKMSELSASVELKPCKRERVLYHQFARRARLLPFQKPLIDASSGKKYSNFTVYSKALALSNYIKELCSDDEKYVGVLLPNTPASAIIILAVMFANKVPAVLNFTVSPETQQRSITNANIKHILTSKQFLLKAKIAEMPEMVLLEKIGAEISKSQALFSTLKGYLLPLKYFLKSHGLKDYKDLHSDGILLFSSGSTAEPKGVRLSHHNLNANLKSFIAVANFSHKDGIVGNLPLFHSFGMNVCFWVPLSTGVKVAYIANPLDAEAIANSIYKYQLTVITATPTFMQSYMRKMTAEKVVSLRLIITGAERLRDEITARFEKISNNTTTIIEGYGCTELSPIVAINFAKDITNLGKKVGKKHSIGVAMPGISAKIVNPETLEDAPANTEGLIMIKSDTVMKGYLNNPELTAEVMVNGYYNTRDIGEMNEDGYITITGRLSRFSKIAGEMVPHESIEQQIYKIIDNDDTKIVVTGAKDKNKGERIIVFHTNEMVIDPQKIIRDLREKKMPNLWIPRAENFIAIKEIPLLGTGKLDLGKISKLAKQYDR